MDRWKVEVVPHITITARDHGLDDDAWDRIEAQVRKAFPLADIWLELDTSWEDTEVNVEPPSAVNELDVLKAFEEAVKQETQP